jgi:hypothetical protein
MDNKLKALVASYGRSVLAAASALYLAGITDPLDLAWSLVAALLPVVIRYINPNDKAFGRMPNEAEIQAALADVKPVKAPVKAAVKPTAKKTTTKK